MIEKISINAQSSIKICDEKTVYFDPFKITVDSNDADVIFITHEHFDHFSPEDIQKVRKDDTIFVMPESMRKTAEESGLASENIIFLAVGEKRDICSIPVETIAAYNPFKPFHTKANGWLGYIITLGDNRIYVAGDTDATPEAEAVKCDIALIPIGGKFTMDHKEAAELIEKISPKTVIPTHYGSVVGSPDDGIRFSELVGKSINVVIKL